MKNFQNPEEKNSLFKKESLWKRLYFGFNNLSLFVKVGFVMALCGLIILLIILTLFFQLTKIENKLYSNYKDYLLASLYVQEKILKSYSLSSNDFERKLSLKEAKRVLTLMLKGGVVPVEKNNIKFLLHLTPLKDPEKIKILKKVLKILETEPEKLKKTEINSILESLQNFTYSLLQEEISQRARLKKLFSQTRTIELFLGVILAIVLLCGGLAFFLMVLAPLKKTTLRIHDITYAKNLSLAQKEPLSVPFNDEIGKLVEEVNNLIKYFSELGQFKRLLEEDESLDDVYERLGQLLRQRFGFSHFVIYTVSNSQNTMEVVYRSPEDLVVNQEILVMADLCRAKRTGRIVSSFETEGICKMFIYENADHICIPLIAGGKVEGVIQLIIPHEDKGKIKEIEEAMPQLQAFLEESLPVIEAKRYAESLKQMAIKDPLTGLYNRRFVEQALDNLTAGILRRGTVLGVLMCDVDYFKKVNDEYGHDVGDEILMGIAKILKQNVRKADIVARFGGEEFLILLVDIRKDEAEKVAEKLRKKVEEAVFETKAGILKKTISIGVSEFPVDAKGIWQVIKFADVALYKAKQMGRNKVVRFRPEMWEEVNSSEKEPQ
jgi:diguanylate cyclase (GGDEF)-like protein